MIRETELKAFYCDKRVVVTGGAGAVGSNLTAKLVSLGADVVVIDDLSSGFTDNLRLIEREIRFIKGDIAHWPGLCAILPDSVDIVFHLAAFFANQNSVEFPERDLSTNGMGTLNICRWASENNVKRLVFSSSSCVYGAVNGKINECVSFDPHTPYAMTKVLGEQYLDFYMRHHGLDAVILRYFNSYGPGEYPGQYRNVIPNFIEKAFRGEPLPLTGSGNETRDFTYVEDTVCGTLLAGMVQEASGGTFNLGSGRETRIKDMAMAVNDAVGNNAGYVNLPSRPWDSISSRLADITHAYDTLGFRPTATLSDGIRQTVSWFEMNMNAEKSKMMGRE